MPWHIYVVLVLYNERIIVIILCSSGKDHIHCFKYIGYNLFCVCVCVVCFYLCAFQSVSIPLMLGTETFKYKENLISFFSYYISLHMLLRVNRELLF